MAENGNKLPRTVLADIPHPEISFKEVRPSHYKRMDIEEVKQYKFPHNIASCLLLFWAWNNFLPEAFDIIKAWGFTYKNIITWIKPHMGLGNYIRNASEHLLVATKGKLNPDRTHRQLSWFIAETREHSRKPEIQYDIAERLGQPPYLELFARRRREGWQSIGDELGKTKETITLSQTN